MVAVIKQRAAINMIKVLFLCIHNSARSQMAGAYLKKFARHSYEVESAGIEPGTLNPYAVAVLKEDGIDISGNKTKSMNYFYDNSIFFDYVITVCDAKNAERCPIFPGGIKLHWNFDDPSSLSGTEAEKLNETRKIRNQIKSAVIEFVEQNKV